MNTCQTSFGSKGTKITEDVTAGEITDNFIEWGQNSTLDSKDDDHENSENCAPSSHNIPTISPHSSIMSSPSRRRWTKYDIGGMIPQIRNPFTNNMTVRDLSNLTPLCNGSHSCIIRAIYQGKQVILKTLTDDSMHRKIAHRDFEIEVTVLSRISHPHIINIVASGFNFCESLGMWRPLIALEYLQGNSLAYHLDTRQSAGVRPFNERQYLRIGRQLASALDYMHREFNSDCVLIHRDLKPDNIAFTAEGTLKLIDFGLCTAIRRGASSTGYYLATGCAGSLRYMAPENALHQPYNEKVDIYSFGMVFYEAITGLPPYRSLTKDTLYEKAIRGGERPSVDVDEDGYPIQLPTAIRELLTQSWNKSPAARPSAQQILGILGCCEATLQRGRLNATMMEACVVPVLEEHGSTHN